MYDRDGVADGSELNDDDDMPAPAPELTLDADRGITFEKADVHDEVIDSGCSCLRSGAYEGLGWIWNPRLGTVVDE